MGKGVVWLVTEETFVSLEEAKDLRAVSANTSLICSQSPLAMKWDLCGWVGRD